MDRDDTWLTTTEAAGILGVSDDTVRRYIHHRRLRATVILAPGSGRPTFRIRRAEFVAFQMRHTRDSVADDWE